jgi:hypothetical protein
VGVVFVQEAHLGLQQKYEPLGREDEPYRWVSELEIAPWAVYVLEGVYGTGDICNVR